MIRHDFNYKKFGTSDSLSNPNCVACKPGYKPIFQEFNKRLIINCEEI